MPAEACLLLIEWPMNDKIKIYAGLALFLILVLFPVWRRAFSGGTGSPPDIIIRTSHIPGSDKCVMPVEYMRTSHMNLLKEWRETVVRTGDRNFISPDGCAFKRSLTNTCLNCHSNKSTFCDRCHSNLGVQPNCWECHVTPHEEGR
jgi:hypothetical protein